MTWTAGEMFVKENLMSKLQSFQSALLKPGESDDEE